MTDLVRLAVVLLVDRSGAVLLQLRGPDAKNYPDLWGLPGGHVEPGERPLDAAVREMFEETGLRVGGLRLFSHDVLSSSGVERFVYCAVTSAAREDLVLGEGVALEFADPGSVVDGRPFVAMDADVLGRFLSSPEYVGLQR